MTREEKQKAIDALKISAPIMAVTQEEFNDYIQTLNKIMDWLEQEPVLDRINKMKSKIAFLLEFWDYSPNNNPLARDMLETLTNFWGEIKAESEE